MIDKALILRKVSELDECFGQLKEYADISLEDYEQNWKTQRIVERTLQIMVEICIDIAHHTIADRDCRVPTTHSDTFKVLYEEGVIDQDLFHVMEKMAKFRNIVVHAYDTIDSAIVVEILKFHLGDFVAFKNTIVSLTRSA